MRKVLLLSLFATASLCGYAQTSKVSIKGEKGISKQQTTLAADVKIPFSPASVRSLLDIDPASALVLTKTESDKLGFVHYRFYQTYHNIPVENSMYIIHSKNALLKSLTGSIVTEFDPLMENRMSAKLSPASAISSAIKKVNAKLYAWQDAAMEARIKAQTGNLKATYAPTVSLVWFSATDNISPRDLRLCYKVDVYARVPLSRAYYYVDAITGDVLGKKDEIFFADATGTAATAYSGTQTIHSDLYNGSYRLRDYTKGNGIITLHGESGSRGNDYTSTSSNWSLSGTNIAALDAHYGVSQTYAFYYSNFGRNSYDNAGTALYSYVNDPTYTDNAFWDGSAMNFNKRSSSSTYPGGVTGIDVTGHELSHGVTQATSGLNYSKEPGAMNESMSDIMGKSVQFWSKPNDINWLLSNDMNWFIRSFSNPNAYSQPDTYKGKYWVTTSSDNYGVHTNSGVGNFMFYLLVTGGSGTNDNSEAYTVSGIGLSEADQIVYRTNTVYLTPTSNYAAWRTACINAATDLYGATSNEVMQVQNAWHAVGVGTAASGGGGTTCAAPTGLTASSITSAGATLSWGAVSGAGSYTLQYKLSSASAWSTVTGLTSASYTLSGLSAGTSYTYQVATVCSGTTSAYSSPYTFTTSGTGTATYCTSSGTTSYEYINNITLGSINNTSGNNSGYGNYTALSTNLSVGSSATIKLKAGFVSGTYKEYWTVYIDYNNDGDFADANETVVKATTSRTTVTSVAFTVPSTAKSGATRMRIQMHYGSYITNSCSAYTYGEVEDYTVNITGGTFGAFATTATLAPPSVAVNPNPVKGGVANVQLMLPANGATTLKLTDVSGKILKVINAGDLMNGRNNYKLDIHELKTGIYILEAQQKNLFIGRVKFVVSE